MDKQYLNDEFNRFFEFLTEDKSHVSSVSAKLFVEHIAYPLEREIEQLRQRVQELEKEPSVESGGEFKTWWEIALHVGAWKNHELDYVHFGSEMAVRAFAIHLLKQRDKEESQLIQTIAKLTAERAALKKLYESSEEYVIALKETRNRLAEERDEWRSKHDVACLTITNLQSKYECQLSATSKAMQGVVELTAERDALKQQRDELLAALEGILYSDRTRIGIDEYHTAKAAIASVKEKT